MLDQNYLDAIKRFEGYASEARWDYAQNTNGYGTRARFAGEVIDKAEADKRFADAIGKAADVVEKFAPNLDDGSKAALTSLTYNAGTAWTESGLGEAIASGDMDKARSIFLQYNKAGGSVLDGLVQRRLQEVAWFGGGAAGAAAGPASAVASAATAAVSGFSGAGATDPSPDMLALVSNPSTPQPYAATAALGAADTSPLSGLGGDPALISLLAHLTKAHLARSGDETRKDEPRKQDKQDTQAQAI